MITYTTPDYSKLITNKSELFLKLDYTLHELEEPVLVVKNTGSTSVELRYSTYNSWVLFVDDIEICGMKEIGNALYAKCKEESKLIAIYKMNNILKEVEGETIQNSSPQKIVALFNSGEIS